MTKDTISKEEILAGIDAGLKDLKAGRMLNAWDVLKEIQEESQHSSNQTK